MNRKEAAQLVSVMLRANPTQASRLSTEAVAGMIDAYAALLGDLDYVRCSEAVSVLLQGMKWIPSVAEIRERVLELECGPARPGGDAWGDVVAAIKKHGAYRSPGYDFSFDDPVVGKCVAALGWQELCLSENQVADRARFIELYDDLNTQDRLEQRVPKLAEARQVRELRDRDRGKVSSVGDHMAGLLAGAHEDSWVNDIAEYIQAKRRAGQKDAEIATFLSSPAGAKLFDYPGTELPPKWIKAAFEKTSEKVGDK